jgi:hypothetical protein
MFSSAYQFWKWKFAPVYFLKAKQVAYLVSENGNKYVVDIVYTDKWRYDVQGQKGFPVFYTGIYHPISRTAVYPSECRFSNVKYATAACFQLST